MDRESCDHQVCLVTNTQGFQSHDGLWGQLDLPFFIAFHIVLQYQGGPRRFELGTDKIA
jgi:hypothetical protein